MKSKLFLFTFLFVSSSYARLFNCSSTETEHEVIRVELDNKGKLVSIAEIAQMPFSSGQLVGQFIEVSSKVKVDESETQSVWFANNYTQRITLKLNTVLKTAQIEVFDTDEWQVTRTENLKCDFEGYYEGRR